MGGAKELYFKDGDKILTLACGFPTTVNPIITNRLIPVFVDIDLEDLSLTPEIFEDAIKKDKKIKGLFIAHTLGFAGKINEILNIARKYNIQVFFDNCDAYACTYNGKPMAAYGKASSYSFYVAHHISMGEGGAVSTNDEDLHTVMKGLRGWGRYCACKQCCIRAELPNSFCPKNKFTKDGGVFPFVISKKNYMIVNGFDTFYPSPYVCDWDFFLRLELNNVEFYKTHNIHFYHFGSSVLKKGVDRDKFAASHQPAAETYYYKWGMSHQLFKNNSHKPNQTTIKGIKF
jgi:hypothetical protein